MNIKKLLREWALRPRKELGQNFLLDEKMLRRIVTAAEVGAEDTILEVGAGPGSLTRLLAEKARAVVAVELDGGLVEILRRAVAAYPHVEIVRGDILALDPAELLGPDVQSLHYKVVANLPYYITSAILRHLLEADVKPTLLVVTVQREVAHRLVAAPGQMSLLAVSVQFYGRPRIVARIPAGSFYPAPQVDSAVVRIDLHRHPLLPAEEAACFFEVVRAGFGQRRKQLRNALAGGLSLPPARVAVALERAAVDSRRRAQTLSLEEWERVYGEIAQELLLH